MSFHYRFFSLWVIFLVGLSHDSVRAQYRFRHLTTNDGLIQGSVYYFLESRDKLMWMTTQVGLVRFDGNQFKSYVHDINNSASISKGEVRGLAEAPDGDIWTGTEVALSRMVRKTGTFKNYYPIDAKGNRVYAQHQVIHANERGVWYLSSQEGLVCFDYKTGKKDIIVPNAHFVYEFRTEFAYFDSVRQKIWLLQPSGILLVDLKSRKTTQLFTGKKNDPFKNKLYAYGIYSKDGQTIWISTDKGIVELDGDQYTLHDLGFSIAEDIVYSMSITNTPNLWISTSKTGLICYDYQQKRIVARYKNDPFRSNSLYGNHLSKVFTDSRGFLWVNVEPVSVDIVYPESLAPFKFEDNLLDNNDLNKASVRGITEDSLGNLWVGSANEGVRKLTPEGQFVRKGNANGFPEESIRQIYCDSLGNNWFCTVNGLYCLRKGADRPDKIVIPGLDTKRSNYVRGILQLDKDYYSIATMSGLYSYSGGKFTLQSGEGIAFSSSMYFDTEKRRLYVGRVDKDLACFELRSGHLEPVYHALQGYNILDFLPESGPGGEMLLWIGTDNGLIKFDPVHNKLLQRIGKGDGYPDHVVYAVKSDKTGGIWSSTNKGIVKYSETKGIQHIRQTDGVEFNSSASYKLKNGRIFFGGTQGLFAIYPDSLSRPSSAGLLVTEIWLNDSVYYRTDDFNNRKFPHNQNDLTFELAALDYTAAIAPIYSYRLIDSNGVGEWVSNESFPTIRFRNLPPDKYRLIFKSLDANGIYSEHPEITFEILSPFWFRWWFITLELMLAFTCAFFIFRLFLLRQRRKQQDLTQRIVEAQETERHRLAMDIHDDVNNTLAAAKGSLELDSTRKTEAINESLNRSRILIQKAADDLRSITHDLMPIDFSQYELAKIIEDKVDEWNQIYPIAFIYILAGNPVKLKPEAELVIYRIILELSHNIRKHSTANQAILQLIYQENELVISIEDDGSGINENNSTHTKGIGMKNLYSRTEYLGARVEISSDASGVLIQIILPYENNRNNKSAGGR